MSSAESHLGVVDTSVAFGWFVHGGSSDNAAALLDTCPQNSLIAPDLLLVDLLNAGWKAWRMGAITVDQFEAIAHLARACSTSCCLPPHCCRQRNWTRNCRAIPSPAGLRWQWINGTQTEWGLITPRRASG